MPIFPSLAHSLPASSSWPPPNLPYPHSQLPGLGSAFSSEWRWRRARVPGIGRRGRQVWWAFPSRGLLRAASPFPHHCQHQSPPAPLPAARSKGGTKKLPNTALQGLKMQHPRQGLKMQSWGWAGQEACCPKRHRGRRSRILPLPSAGPRGPERLQRLGELRRRTPHLPGIAPPPPSHPRVPAAPAEGCRRRRVPGAYLCDSHAGTRGAAGRGRGVRGRRPGSACGRGGSGRAPHAPREARPSRGARAPGGRAGSAQGPLVGARPPLFADVSPKCAFIIDEPLSPQEGEAGRKGARERAGLGGGGRKRGRELATKEGAEGGGGGGSARPPAAVPRASGPCRWPLGTAAPGPGPGAEAGGRP